jgi:hypothetical protein
MMFASNVNHIAGWPKQHAGHAMQRVHSHTLSKNDPRCKSVKYCFDQVGSDRAGQKAPRLQQ